MTRRPVPSEGDRPKRSARDTRPKNRTASALLSGRCARGCQRQAIDLGLFGALGALHPSSTLGKAHMESLQATEFDNSTAACCYILI